MTCFIQKVLKASLLGEMFVLPSVIRIIVIEFKPSRVFSITRYIIKPSNVAIMITNYNHLEPLENILYGWLIAA